MCTWARTLTFLGALLVGEELARAEGESIPDRTAPPSVVVVTGDFGPQLPTLGATPLAPTPAQWLLICLVASAASAIVVAASRCRVPKSGAVAGRQEGGGAQTGEPRNSAARSTLTGHGKVARQRATSARAASVATARRWPLSRGSSTGGSSINPQETLAG